MSALLADGMLPSTWSEFGAIGAVAAFAYLVFRLLISAKDAHIAYLERQVTAWMEAAKRAEQRAVDSEQVTSRALNVAKEQTEIVRQVARDEPR